MATSTTAGFVPRSLSQSGNALPPSIPLVVQRSYDWDKDQNTLLECQTESRSLEGESQATARPAQLKVVQEALDVLRSIDKPLAILSICGPFRTGKSYLLSRILGSPGVFQVGHSMNACTRGIWMGTTILEHEDFAVVFLDTEGTDSCDGDDESVAIVNKLLMVTTLLSSFMIYNSSGVPEWSDLEDLSCFSQLSSSLISESTAEYDSISDNFPDFLWLIRDFTLQLPRHDTEDRQLTPTEYLKKKVLCRSNKPAPTNEDIIVNAIYHLFPSIDCRTLPRPSADPEVVTSMEQCHDKLDAKFQDELQLLLDHLWSTGIIKTKNTSTGPCSNGSFLAEFVKHLVSQVNDDTPFKLKNTYLTAAEVALSKFSEKLLLEYKREMKVLLKGKLPLEEYNQEFSKDTLLSIHNQVMAPKSEKFDKEISHFFPVRDDPSIQEKVKTLQMSFTSSICSFTEEEIVVGGALHHFAMANMKASRKFCQELALQVFGPVREKVYDALVSRSSTIDITSDVLEAEKVYFERAIGPAKFEVCKESRKELNSLAESCSKIPARPEQLCATGWGKNRINLKWIGTNSDSSAVHHYQIRLMHGVEDWEVLPEQYPLESAAINKLQSNTEYSFQVRAVGVSKIIGNWSETCKCSTTLGSFTRGAATLGSFVLGVAASPAAGLLVAGPVGAVGGLLGAPAFAGCLANAVAKSYGPKGDLVKKKNKTHTDSRTSDASREDSPSQSNEREDTDNPRENSQSLSSETVSVVYESDD